MRILKAGIVYFGLVFAAGFLLGPIRIFRVSDYLASRDPVSGTVYYVMLIVFVITPLLVARR